MYGQENPAFQSTSRDISANLDRIELKPAARKKNMFYMDNSKTFADAETQVDDLSMQCSRGVNNDGPEDRPWQYTLCLKFRSQQAHPSWQPSTWPKICPYPFCPTYRQFSRLVSLLLIGILAWGTLYALIGDTVLPGGQLFQLMFLGVFSYVAGWLMSLTSMPALVGMLFGGVLLQNVGLIDINQDFGKVTKQIRQVALVIILTRAGLDLDPNALRRHKFTVTKLGLIPWMTEACTVAVMSHFLLDLTWEFAFLLGSIVAAVSPAVVVPGLFSLRSKGYGVAKGIPTLIIASAVIDDAISVTTFSIIKSIIFSKESLTMQVIQGPVSIIGGIGFGILWGFICNFAPERHDPFVVPLRVIQVLVGGMVAIFGSELIGFSGAGPLGCVSAAFGCIFSWTKQGWPIGDNPAAGTFAILWMVFEALLFGLVGTQIKLEELDGHILSIGAAILVTGIVLRMLLTILVATRSQLNLKEKIFVALAWMSKATVQAALSPVALSLTEPSTVEYDYGKKILMICVLAIMLTAPTGAIIIRLSGPRLLTKTTFPEGVRRSHRPSLRDISINNEEEERNGRL